LKNNLDIHIIFQKSLIPANATESQHVITIRLAPVTQLIDINGSNYQAYNYIFSTLLFLENKILILLVPSLIMGSEKGDEHLHHPVCEVCQKEFNMEGGLKLVECIIVIILVSI
jgi:hypothetical protein